MLLLAGDAPPFGDGAYRNPRCVLPALIWLEARTGSFPSIVENALFVWVT